jgi:zinc transporter ZupT
VKSKDNAGLEEGKKTATMIWGMATAQEVAPGTKVPIGVFSNLQLNKDLWVTIFKIRTAEDGSHAIFAKHDLGEFENRFHYLRDAEGNDVEPAYEDGKEVDGEGHLRVVAVFVTALASAIGLFVFHFERTRSMLTQESTLNVRAMSAGTMLSVSIAHIFPEASEVMTTVTNVPLGAFIFLIGILLMYGLDLLSRKHIHDHEEVRSVAVAEAPDACDGCAESGNSQFFVPQPVMSVSNGAMPHSGMPEQHFGPTTTSQTGMVFRPSQGMSIMGSAFGAKGTVFDKMSVEEKMCGCVYHKQMMMAFTLSAHSIVLGISLGLSMDRKSIILVLIVFVIHQLLEAMCVSHTIGSLHVPQEKIIAWILIVFSMPIGIAIGLIVWASLYKDGMMALLKFPKY